MTRRRFAFAALLAAGKFAFAAATDKSMAERNRESMSEALSNIRSLKVSIAPAATDLTGDVSFVRYKQSLEMMFPLKDKPMRNWRVAEDTSKFKNGEWRLMETRTVNDGHIEAQRMPESKRRKWNGRINSANRNDA